MRVVPVPANTETVNELDVTLLMPVPTLVGDALKVRFAPAVFITTGNEASPVEPVLATPPEAIDPDEGIATIGSGGSFALAAATALMENTEMSAREIVERSMKIAAEICIYSNTSVTIEELKGSE